MDLFGREGGITPTMRSHAREAGVHSQRREKRESGRGKTVLGSKSVSVPVRQEVRQLVRLMLSVEATSNNAETVDPPETKTTSGR